MRADTKARRYAPDINPSYQELTEHYGIGIFPARSRKPRDKSIAELAVLTVERRILAPVRDLKHFSIAELNASIAPLLEKLNDAPFQKRPQSRCSQFEELDLPAMRPLPAQPYVYRLWKKARLNMDTHIEVEQNYYSVPHQYARQSVDVCISPQTVEVYIKGKRICSHMRSYRQSQFCTTSEHMSKGYLHCRQRKSVTRKVRHIGPHATQMADKILESRPIPEQGCCRIYGIVRLCDKYGPDRPDRVNVACGMLLEFGSTSYRGIVNILKSRRDLEHTEEQESETIHHDYIRGPSYYGESS